MRDDAACAYCAFPADGYDHLTPVSRQTTRRRRGKMASVSERVPCCAMCNSLLGACPAFTVRDRAAVLLLRYAERPRSEARETWLKARRLLTIVAGFELEAEIEAIDERQRQRIDAIAEAERLRVRHAFEEERRAEEDAARRRARRVRIRLRNVPCQPYSMVFLTEHGFVTGLRRYRIRQRGRLAGTEISRYIAELDRRAARARKSARKPLRRRLNA